MTTLDRERRSALHYAALGNDISEVRRLLDDGADPNLGDRHGFTPLHFACQGGALEIAHTLLDHGASVDSVNDYGNTPLWVAVFESRGRGDLIGLLRSRGADPRHANNAGQTPVGLARLIGNFDAARFFADLR